MTFDKETQETIKMISDYMQKGFLENIVDMFKHDKNCYQYIGELIKDERLGVRIGTTALVETLAEEDGPNTPEAIPSIAEALKDEIPTIRGDAAYLLGVIGHPAALPFLEEALSEEYAQIKESIEEAIEDIKSGG